MILLGLKSPPTDKTRKPYMFYPNDTIKIMGWDLIISVILLVTCMITPFNLAFQEEVEKIRWYMNVNYTIDILFGIDIVLNFLTAFQNELYEVVDDRKQIAIRYLKGWFIIDLLAIIPFDLILSSF